MTPDARIAATVELLEEISAQNRPADLIAGAWLKARRFIGAKDRRAISDRLWGILRRRARLTWLIEQQEVRPTPRLLVLVDLLVSDRQSPAEIAALCKGGSRGLPGLTNRENTVLDKLQGQDIFHHAMPGWVRGEYPEWVEEPLKAAFGERFAAEMGALRDEAPVDLRINTLKTDRDTAQGLLAKAGLVSKQTVFSPLGLRLPARIALTAQDIFRDGLVEVQDEGSQILSLLTGAKPGMSVVDFCAGAGGKTLALAAMMQNKGRLVACDVHAKRSERAAARLRRAGVHNVVRQVLESENDRWVKRHAGTFDRVLVDAPCSGTGTWRRNPDSKWRLLPGDVDELAALQGRILASAARLVRPGGQLIYATCSLFPAENEQRIEAFLEGSVGFSLKPLPPLWAERVGTSCPVSGDVLRLSPAGQGTDGFFAAVLEKAV